MPVKSSLKVSSLSYVIVYVNDTAKALPFYKEVLGFKVKSEVPGWVELDLGNNTTLALHGEDKTDPTKAVRRGNSTIAVFNVDDVNEAFETLKSNGVKVLNTPQVVCETPDHLGMCVEFEDPDGNALSLFAMHKK
ncbi:MAG TPA: VOC family protein [Trichormus sp.]|jgi:lactoylglutathione lyase